MNDLGTVRLETERLILRRFELEDAEGMYNNWASDDECTKFMNWNTHKDVDETISIVRNWVNLYEQSLYLWIVEIKKSNEVIGSICAVNINKKHSTCEIGYSYGSKYWNKGYATEALKAVIGFMLDECGLRLVQAMHISGNPASGRVMEKAGMQKDAVLRERQINKHTGEVNDLVVYSATK